MVTFSVEFLGATVVDRRFSNPMIPWIAADIKKGRKTQKIRLNINQKEIIGEIEDVVLFQHDIQNLHRFCLEPNSNSTFMHLVKDKFEPVFNVYLFQAARYEDVMEVFQTLRESTRETPGVTKSHSSGATLTSLCPDISPTNSQFFEVLYVGKMKISHKKVPETFIDDALEKFRLYEVEKGKKELHRRDENSASEKDLSSTNKETDTNNVVKSNEIKSSDLGTNNNLLERLIDNATSFENNKVTDRNFHSLSHETIKPDNPATSLAEISTNKSVCHSTESKQDKRPKIGRSCSLGTIETSKRKADGINQNRTMLFYVGRTDLRLISPDRKQVLLNKMLKEINCCVQGIKNNEHFGIICREIDGYFGYVFKCESNCVADHIVSAISQSFHAIKEAKDRSRQQIVSCELCPMVWFHKLCAELEDQSDKKRQLTILKKIETLSDQEQTDIYTKFLGAESSDIKDQNEFLMILLRTHCERKQSRHIHDTEESRSEFLNQVLGGNTIFMKAKRSLTNSFDHLLKRKGPQQDVLNSKEFANRKSDLNTNGSLPHDNYYRSYLTVGSADGEIMKKEISKQMNNRMQNFKKNQKGKRNHSESGEKLRKATSLQETSDYSSYETDKCMNRALCRNLKAEADASKTPLRNIFLKVGSASKTNLQENRNEEETSHTPSGSWRQAIFNRVVTPGKADETEGGKPLKRNKEQLRYLWRTAINQQILLIRMEKENARLKARQEEATVKRIKLEYDEMGNFSKEQLNFWDMISSKDCKISSKCDVQAMLPFVRQGIPRARRGDAWYYLTIHHCLKEPEFDSSTYPNYDVSYEDLLKQLTSFQHTILIDLGRTFPNHPYFSSPLGPGQLALFNLLKAYSLLDSQVGYCQGLSFVAGVLLLHLFEDQAFLLLKHLMLRRNLRKQYLPDMAALQIQLYQLSRLLHDFLPKLYVHFDKNEISPTLYAASWMLTLFASQFPLGFVTRVFDLLFVEQPTNLIFRVILALLEEHSLRILRLSNFEEIMDYLKFDIPKMDAATVDRVIKKVLSMDITKILHEYEVEYHVLQEEISTPRAELNRLKKVEVENKKLLNENLALQEEMEILTRNLNYLEKLRLSQQNTIRKLETKTKNLELTVKFLGNFISEVGEKNKSIDMPGEIRRIISNLNQVDNNMTDKAKNSIEKSEIFRRIHSTDEFYQKPTIYEFCRINGLANGTKVLDQLDGSKEKSQELPIATDKTSKDVDLKQISSDKKNQRFSRQINKFTSDTKLFSDSSNTNRIENEENKNDVSDNFKEFRNHEHKTPSSRRNCLSENENFNFKETNLKLEKKENCFENSLNKISKTSMNNKISLNSAELTVKESPNKDNHLHPLDSLSGVDITFNGTTKLKSIKSGHELIKNKAFNCSSSNNQVLHIAEDGDP